MKKVIGILLLALSSSLLAPQNCSAQYIVLLSFNGADGGNPYGSLVPGALNPGTLYGMAYAGGAKGYGRIFSIETNGSGYTDLLDFNDSNGANPYGALTFSGSKFWGMTEGGGKYYNGCIFSFNTNGGIYKDIHDFNGAEGAEPYGSLLYTGKLFGMTKMGGAHDSGCIFSMDTDGSNYKVLLSFDDTTGAYPQGSLLDVFGVLYGMTELGGAHGKGCVFSIDTNGKQYKDILDFDGSDGANPYGSLTLYDNERILCGMTAGGGKYSNGCIFLININGSGYKDIHDFNDTTGAEPWGDLTYNAGVFYGMASYGGANGFGCIFSIDTGEKGYKDMFDFNNSNGQSPFGDILYSSGILYGMTNEGDTDNDGIIFAYNTLSTGIEELTIENSPLTIYPNPSNGVFTVEAKGEELRAKSIEVFNVLGEQVYSQLSTFNSQLLINLSSNPSGVYLYWVLSDAGVVIGSGKLVIDK